MAKLMSADEKLYLISENKKEIIDKFIEIIKENSIENFSSNNITKIKNEIKTKISAVEQYRDFIKVLKEKLEKTKNDKLSNDLKKQIKIIDETIHENYIEIEVLNEYLQYYNM